MNFLSRYADPVYCIMRLIVGLLFAALRWSVIFDAIRSLARTIQAGHFSLRFFADDIQRLSIFLDFVIVGALVSIAVQRLFAR